MTASSIVDGAGVPSVTASTHWSIGSGAFSGSSRSTHLPPVALPPHCAVSPWTISAPSVPLISSVYGLHSETKPVSETPIAPFSNSMTETALSSTPRFVTCVNVEVIAFGAPSSQ